MWCVCILRRCIHRPRCVTDVQYTHAPRSITQQLDAGARFIDLRATWTRGPSGGSSPYDWYALHLVETNHTNVFYMKAIAEWMRAHPTEVVVMSLTRHGDFCVNGTDQYPGTTPAIRQLLWQQAEVIFGDLLFDRSKFPLLNETSLATMVDAGMRLVMYVADYETSTRNSTLASNAQLVVNAYNAPLNEENPGLNLESELIFTASVGARAYYKAHNQFQLVHLSFSNDTAQIE